MSDLVGNPEDRFSRVAAQMNYYTPMPHLNNSFVAVLKKAKHRVVESMSSNTADALGLSRAILCNGMLYLKTISSPSKSKMCCKNFENRFK